jgi:hypothetical protein
MVKEYRNKTTRQKYAKSEPYLLFKQGIFVCQSSSSSHLVFFISFPFRRRFATQEQPCLPSQTSFRKVWLLIIYFAVSQNIPEDGDASDDDDDVEMGGVTQDYKCPLTLTTLVDPMTS